MTIEGLTVVSPMWGDRTKTDRMVFSVIHQYIDKENPFKIHLVLVDDYLEKRSEDGKSYYDYYLSEEFKKFYDTEQIKITLIKNSEHKYQGESREIGYMAGDYNFFLLIDCDDMLAPNACSRYINCLRENTLPEKEEDRVEGRTYQPISCVEGFLYGFGPYGSEQYMPGDSIWVQGRCYNRDFLIKYDIHFPTGMNSKCGEDYPFIRKLDYAITHQQEYQCIQFGFHNHEEHCQCTAYWFPNEESLSRQDAHYCQHLSGWTMNSSFEILKYFMNFNKKYGLEEEMDENMKREALNMNIYSFYNLLDFIREVSMTDYIPVEEDWYALRNAANQLRKLLKKTYWQELIYSDIEDMLYEVRHYSDVHFVESWIGTFFDYMNNYVDILDMEYQEMMDYAHSLEFDGCFHEVHAPYVVAWVKRHQPQEVEEKIEE